MHARNMNAFELLKALEERNTDGRYDRLIANARSGRYHGGLHLEGPARFLRHTEQFPELGEIRREVRRGMCGEGVDRETRMGLWGAT